jgi:phospholipase A1
MLQIFMTGPAFESRRQKCHTVYQNSEPAKRGQQTANHTMSNPRHRLGKLLCLVCTATTFWMSVTSASAQENTTHDEQCMLHLLKNGQTDMTLGQIRAQCSKEELIEEPEEVSTKTSDSGSASRRIDSDRQAITSPFSILAHKPNYFLVGAYNFKGWDPTLYREISNDPGYDNKDVEAQFQISLKVPLAINLFDGRMDIYGAYTNRSFWQMYNSEYSEPFRETNHEPELWLQFSNDWQVMGFTNVVNTLGGVHQSNGRGGTQSRDWNRLYAHFIFEKDNWVLSFKPWIWVTKDKSESDNPDITDFMGHGEFRTAYSRGGHVYSMMLRNQLESGFNKGAVELSWSLPVFDYPYLKGYVQYFYGYGESLIDYNRKVNRIGVGISITDWIK